MVSLVDTFEPATIASSGRAGLPNALPSKIGQSNSVQPGQAFGTATQGATFGVFNSTLDRTVGLGTSRQMQLSMRVNF